MNVEVVMVKNKILWIPETTFGVVGNRISDIILTSIDLCAVIGEHAR